MRRRHYLTEDIAQIQRYFPGARAMKLCTPFDITPRPRRIIADMFQPEQATPNQPKGILRWTN